jgi:quinol monooxygenase YgiN
MATAVRRRVAFVARVVAVYLSLSAIALAQEVIRISSYRARFGRNAEISKVTDAEITGVYAGMKGLKWLKFYYDPVSGDRGSVTVWADRAALDAYMKSDERKSILEKLRPLIEGDVSSKIYVVYERKK